VHACGVGALQLHAVVLQLTEWPAIVALVAHEVGFVAALQAPHSRSGPHTRLPFVHCPGQFVASFESTWSGVHTASQGPAVTVPGPHCPEALHTSCVVAGVPTHWV